MKYFFVHIVMIFHENHFLQYMDHLKGLHDNLQDIILEMVLKKMLKQLIYLIQFQLK